MTFEGKVSIVTGGGKGIGKAISLKLAALGSNVAVVCQRDTCSAEETVDEIKRLDRDGLAIQADVSTAEGAEKVINSTLKKFGRLDVLVNNAGLAIFKPFIEVTEEDWDRTLAVNLKSVFLLSKLAAQQMIDQKTGGSIVNIGSTAGDVGIRQLSHYCASKGGLNTYTKAMAFELAPYKIRVNAVNPGTIMAGESLKVFEEDPSIVEEHVKEFPLGRLGEPEDCAGIVAFLASDQADWITGQLVYVDGGLLCYH